MEGEQSDDHRSLKPWFLRVTGAELRFEARLLVELIGAALFLLMREGSTQATMKGIRSLTNVMVPHQSVLVGPVPLSCSLCWRAFWIVRVVTCP